MAALLSLDELGLPPADGPEPLPTRVLRIGDRAREMASSALHRGVHRVFSIARTHYERIDLDYISQGFAPGYTEEEIDEIEAIVAPLARRLAESIEKEGAKDAAEDAAGPSGDASAAGQDDAPPKA